MRLTILSALAGAVVLAAPVSAQETTASLVGTWTQSEINGRSWSGATFTRESFVSSVIEITSQDGPIFAGVIRWKMATDDHGFHDGTQDTNMAEEELLGVRDFDGTYIVVEVADTTVRRFRLIDANTFQSVVYEAGPHALVAVATYTRQ